MQFIVPDILAEARGLSVPSCAAGMVLGLCLWVLGGRGHRFWLVLLTTLAAGVYGLSIGKAFEVQPLVSALLLAVTAGMLALSLVRVGAFLTGGAVACVVGARVLTGWNEPFIFFFVGGFLGLLLLRFWLMVLTSLGGTLLMAYSLLWMLDTLNRTDAVEWSAKRPVLLNWACAGVALLGLLIQVGLERRAHRGDDSRGEERKETRGRGLFGRRGSDDPKKGRRAA